MAAERGNFDFPLLSGGPFHKYVLSRLGPKRRVALPFVVAWLPLFILAGIDGRATGGALPFARDFACHVRFLLAAPLLLGAERLLELRVEHVARYLVRAHLVADEDYDRYRAILDSALRLRASAVAELLLLVLAFVVSLVALPTRSPLVFSSWRSTVGPGGTRYTAAFFWFLFVSLPLFLFLVGRFLWRFVIWSRVLVQTARLRLTLIASHPDRAGGLAAIQVAHGPFGLIPTLALSMVFAAGIGELHAYAGADLRAYLAPYAAFAGLAVVLLLAPLLAFTPKLIATRDLGVIAYGRLGEKYVADFQDKWIRPISPSDSPLGSSDIQSLADFHNSLEGVRKMHRLLIDREALATVLAPIVAPLLPLSLVYVPLPKLFSVVVKLLG